MPIARNLSQSKFYWEPRVVNEKRNKGMCIRAVQ